MMQAEIGLLVFTALHHAVVSDKTAAVDSVVASPLFGSSQLGEPFDDVASTATQPIVGLHSLSIAYGPYVFGIQASYLLQNGEEFSGVVHGTIDKSTSRNLMVVQFRRGEHIQRISGAVKQTYGFITMLKLYTTTSKGEVKVYGPFGTAGSCDTPFNFTGAVIGLFGRSYKYLNALGVYINPKVTPTYNRTQLIGGIYGTRFDDYSALSSGPAEIVNITINSNAFIFGFGATYRLPNGTIFSSYHGPHAVGPNNTVITFSDDEKIVRTDLEIYSLLVSYLMFSTLDSRGVQRVYGPFGDIPAMNMNIITVYGTVYGFHGSVGTDHFTAMTGIGFYI